MCCKTKTTMARPPACSCNEVNGTRPRPSRFKSLLAAKEALRVGSLRIRIFLHVKKILNNVSQAASQLLQLQNPGRRYTSAPGTVTYQAPNHVWALTDRKDSYRSSATTRGIRWHFQEDFILCLSSTSKSSQLESLFLNLFFKNIEYFFWEVHCLETREGLDQNVAITTYIRAMWRCHGMSLIPLISEVFKPKLKESLPPRWLEHCLCYTNQPWPQSDLRTSCFRSCEDPNAFAADLPSGIFQRAASFLHPFVQP